MEKIKNRQNSLEKSINSLERSVEKYKNKKFTDLNDYQEFRDSIIQRFEFTTDIFWKFISDYLKDEYSMQLDIIRPKPVLKESQNVGILSQEEHDLAIKMIESRNITSHSYNEELAEKITHEIPQYFDLIKTVFNRIKS
ncbi:TPA: hypothetical protein DEO28_04675 [Candidatus Dependentiae bacterium]|nr:MAG: Nucleotidyltransferase substrate binding protein, HI0074 family [candidate division TM6 bacterium GW2011_GWE2_31_21]KKP53850.1 MAG: Nucleotidyltransferase substrate binding protein, HI0074 family [candidate division TM6 bacterium GW2011_GWF2_33_332]HBS47629.1 hypothetical protein [Candidatus Dependentiae bacterium]HBZ73778.1 hypothetical protein [Candidatus Dependentiae bacterium]